MQKIITIVSDVNRFQNALYMITFSINHGITFSAILLLFTLSNSRTANIGSSLIKMIVLAAMPLFS